MQANLNPFDLISTSMSHVQPERKQHKALPLPPFGKSDHNYMLLIPAYKQKLKQEVSVTRSKRKWSDDVGATLEEGFARTDWNMFWD